VDQGGGVEGVAGGSGGHSRGGELPQLVVCVRQQVGRGPAVAGRGRIKEAGHLGHHGRVYQLLGAEPQENEGDRAQRGLIPGSGGAGGASKEFRVGQKQEVVRQGGVSRIAQPMALAIRFEHLVRTGQVASFAELARLGKVTRPRIGDISNLLHLAPDI
jgi:hypothetical protein